MITMEKALQASDDGEFQAPQGGFRGQFGQRDGGPLGVCSTDVAAPGSRGP